MIYKEAIQDAISMHDLPAEWSPELLKEADFIASKTKINIKKDDCINNFFEVIIKSLKNKKYNFFYKNILYDSELRQKINLF